MSSSDKKSLEEVVAEEKKAFDTLKLETVEWAKKKEYTGIRLELMILASETTCERAGLQKTAVKIVDDFLMIAYLRDEKEHFKTLLKEAESEIAFLKGQGEKNE